MVKYEYKVIYYSLSNSFPSIYDNQLANTLNKNGEDGWELIIMHNDGLIFKRKKGE